MARTSVNDIANSLRNYPALRSNRYEVYIALPQVIGGGLEGPFWATNVVMPGRNLATQERRTFGPQRDMPYERLFSGDMEITFMLTSGGWERNIFERWMDGIIDPLTNRIKGSRNEYLGQIEIDLLGEDGNSIEYGIVAQEVFPKQIAPVSLSYNSENELVQQQISFSFRNYEQKNANQSNSFG